MKLAWCTDIHLNFIDDDARLNFYQEIMSTKCDAVLLTGGIAEAPSIIDILNEMVAQINQPIYFVLGNHDYYKGQIIETREMLATLSNNHDKLFWLPAFGIIQLNNETILLGQDGWADGRLGDYQNSRVILNDSRMIADLFQAKILGKNQLLDKMQQLADEDARALKSDLERARDSKPKSIIVLTHVPPFKEACLHEGKISNDDWLPYFSSKVIGDVLMEAAHENPMITYLVLCGHTHSNAYYKPHDNLTVKVGSAEYCQPGIQELIILEGG